MDKIFAKGLYFDKKEKAPSYVVGALSIKVSEFIQFLNENQNNAGYCNIDLKQAKNGKYYAELNQWQPVKDKVKEEESNQEALNNIEYPTEDIDPEDIPF